VGVPNREHLLVCHLIVTACVVSHFTIVFVVVVVVVVVVIIAVEC
jgi:hypothetical protein